MKKHILNVTAVLISIFLTSSYSVKATELVKVSSNSENKSKSIQVIKKAQAQAVGRSAAGELIIKYKDGTTISKKQESLSKIKKFENKQHLNLINSDVIKLPSDINMDDAIKTLKESDSVESVQPNYIYQPSSISSDARASEQWGLENLGQTINGRQGVAGIDIGIKDAWNVSKGSDKIVVGVVDTGIDINHPDLKDKIWLNTSEVAGNGQDDDYNGYIDDVNGWNFYENNNQVYNPEDGDSHGTHVAGIIAASLNNIGVVGVAPNVKIMPLKVMGPYGGTTETVIKAIEYAKRKGVKILNMSLGNSSYDAALKDAIDKSGCLVVAAAGNNGSNNDSSPIYPASFDSSNIISVAAIDNTGKLTSYSDYGVNSVDIAAPGDNILSTVPRRTQLGAAVESDTGTYKTLLQGFGLESMISDSDRKQLMLGSLNFFGMNSGDPILLVQDDESDSGYGFANTASYYSKALQDSGFSNVASYRVSYLRNGPSLSTMASYKLVIWFTGGGVGLNYSSGNYMLTAADLTNIESYLNSGGKLYLSGEHIAYNMSDTSFLKDYMHTVHLTDDYNRQSLSGSSGTGFEGKHFNLNSGYEDLVKPSDSQSKTALSYDEEAGYDNSYEYFSGTSMAAPYVTGTAALLFSYGVYDPVVVKEKLISTAKPLQSLSGKVLSGGLLNAASAISAARNAGKSDLFNRLWGSNRYDTSVSISKYGWSSATSIVIATGEDFPDALSSAPLARKYNAPILLTQKSSLTSSVEAEINRLGAKNAFIIGGEGVISKTIEDTLREKNINVVRLSGRNRYETSASIANYLGKSNEIVVATGNDFPDALSIASYAAFNGIPILLSESNNLYSGVSDYIARNNVSKAYVIGGTGVISNSVSNVLPNAERIAGRNRYETNVAILNRFNDRFDITSSFFATGEDFPDALAGSVLAAQTESPIILVGKTVDSSTLNFIKPNVSRIQNKQILGGEGAVSSNTMNNLLN